MADSIRSVLSPLLLISYVCGLRIIEFPSGYTRPWFSLLYFLILWTVYFFFVIYILISHIINHYSNQYLICLMLNNFSTILSVVFGMYHDKKFRKSLKKLVIVDNTLEQLGITTNYQKLRMRIIWFVLGWFMLVILLISSDALWLCNEFDYEVTMAVYIPSVLNYCVHVGFIDDFIITSILGYIGLKFDQINEKLRELTEDDKSEIKHAWGNAILHSRQCRPSKIPSNKYMTWIIIHLHLELCKISRDINTTFGMQMTLKMPVYFSYVAVCSWEIFSVTFIHNYAHKKKDYLLILLFWIVLHVLKVLLINCVCERVSVKANLIGNFTNNILYSTYDVEVCENISQLILQITRAPLRFYGIGLFQFGYNYLRTCCKSIATVLVILIQAFTNKQSWVLLSYKIKT